MEIKLLPNKFLLEDGTFDKKSALNLCGKIAGICYSQYGFETLEDEDEKKTNSRIDRTINNGHHSVYDHVLVNLNIRELPKILAMVLNNEKQYTTSEKSARYTRVEEGNKKEIELYNKWKEIFNDKITLRYGDVFDERKCDKLAGENARYLVSVFMPTEMIYSTTIRQLNYIVSWMKIYIENSEDEFSKRLSKYMKEFIDNIDKLNLLEEGLLRNEKKRSISLFGKNVNRREELFSDVYSVNYEASFAYFAQAQRHRTIDYEIKILENKKYYVPPIIERDENLVKEWLEDMNKVSYPQGELILINERGTYENFILKCKERLCSAAQLEICNKTKEILDAYSDELNVKNHPLKDDINLYTKGARCSYPGYECTEKCLFKEGINLTRKI